MGIAYKGTDNNMKCLDFQYEVGKEYTHDDDVKPCASGFHACEYPLDVLAYYEPAKSRYFEVEQSGKTEKSDDKTVSSNLKIKAEIGIVGLVKAAVDYTMSRCTKSKEHHSTGNGAASSSTGYGAASSSTGYGAASSSTGDGAASSSTGKESIAVAWGYESRALIASPDSYMVIADWREKNGERYLHRAHMAKVGDIVRKKKIRANVWYWFEDGKLRSEQAK